jgi:hypothetical protein
LGISNSADLLAFMPYESNGKINEDFLFSQSLPTHNTDEAIFSSLNDFILENETG